MSELLLGAIPVAVALFWRISYDAGRRYGRQTNVLTIDGTTKALIVDNYALRMMRDLRPDLDRAIDEYQEIIRAY